ncbi:MAG: DUF1287 domain-containing protein [Bdellovibrionales bacterium]|nr:DUF1287 domain-containing protein [Bdellovibrionales bacterium]
MGRKLLLLICASIVAFAAAGYRFTPSLKRYLFADSWLGQYSVSADTPEEVPAYDEVGEVWQYSTHERGSTSFGERLAEAAEAQTGVTVGYDPSYAKISYPGGDVDQRTGVCTDVVIRAYRALGIDLQEKVHLDMKEHFAVYPKLWGLSQPDTNIDHRRVPNLMRYFSRHGSVLPLSEDPCAYRTGDIVTWDLGSGMTHIGIVARTTSDCRKSTPMILHNFGQGTKREDVLFNWRIIGHFRYEPPTPSGTTSDSPPSETSANRGKLQEPKLSKPLDTQSTPRPRR